MAGTIKTAVEQHKHMNTKASVGTTESKDLSNKKTANGNYRDRNPYKRASTPNTNSCALKTMQFQHANLDISQAGIKTQNTSMNGIGKKANENMRAKSRQSTFSSKISAAAASVNTTTIGQKKTQSKSLNHSASMIQKHKRPSGIPDAKQLSSFSNGLLIESISLVEPSKAPAKKSPQ